MDKKRSLLLLVVFVSALLSVALPMRTAHAAASGPRVECWVSILPQAYLVKSVGGDRVGVRVMVGPGQVPHTYEPTARQLSELSSARLFFSVGVAFEDALLPRIERNFRTVKIVDMTSGVKRRLASEDEFHGSDQKDAAQRPPEKDAPADSHGHGGFDPHVWLSPRIAAVMARNTRDALVAVDPEGADAYRSNCHALEAELDSVDAELAERLRPYRGREIFVFHPAYGYFTDAYGLAQTAIEENGAAPGPRHLAEVIDRAREQGTKTVYIQPQGSASYAETGAKAIGAKLVTLDPLAEDYIKNLNSMARAIVAAFDEPGTR